MNNIDYVKSEIIKIGKTIKACDSSIKDVEEAESLSNIVSLVKRNARFLLDEVPGDTQNTYLDKIISLFNERTAIRNGIIYKADGLIINNIEKKYLIFRCKNVIIKSKACSIIDSQGIISSSSVCAVINSKNIILSGMRARVYDSAAMTDDLSYVYARNSSLMTKEGISARSKRSIITSFPESITSRKESRYGDIDSDTSINERNDISYI